MAIREVIVYPNEILRRKNTDITEFDSELKTLTEDMFETMYKHEGIGLAGPQIAVNRNIVVIDIPEEDGTQGKNKYVIINPKITALDGEIVDSQEGCLSVPGYQDTVQRYPRCTVEYQDIEGKPCKFDNVDGLLAICLQHEIDHLQGKVFVDKLSRMKRERLHKKYEKYEKSLHGE
ncbi:MAG: peptide deformylase [Succinivibrio sp.]